MNKVFPYTREAIEIVLKSLKKYGVFFKYGSLIFATIYFTFVLITKTGNFYINIILAALFGLYTLFEFITRDFSRLKLTRRVIKKSYKGLRYSIRFFALGAMIYGVYMVATNVTLISVVLATLMIVMWILQIFIEVVVTVIEDKLDLILAGVDIDVENYTRPITAVTNVIKKVKGEDVEKPHPRTPEQLLLIEKVSQKKEEAAKLKKELQAAKKAQKKAQKKK